ncbi:MAG: CDP-glycerol glycerophosphotransferase family protein [Bacteroidales bacterium]|nr:CDP-glycerol glycerophosphotransferase family protein [Bacteroidales bacterium]
MFRELIKRFFVRLCPVHKNWIVFDSFFGMGYGDSPGAIADEILKRKLPYKLFWRVAIPEKASFPKGIIPIPEYSLKTLFTVASSSVWISNTKSNFPWPKKKNQYYIQTWHGGGLPLKQVEGQVENFLGTDYVLKSKRDSAQTDMILADNNLIADIYRNWFWYPASCEIACIGLPKNDGFYHKTDISTLKNKYFGRSDVKIALYAPTFRDDNSTEGYRIDLKAAHQALEEKSGDKWLMAVRLHPNIRDLADDLFTFDEIIINATSFPDPKELILASDMLFTDYSSIMSDFLALDKPVFLFLMDLDHYLSSCRTIGPVFYNLPFPCCYTNDDLIKAIDAYDPMKYQSTINDFKHNCFISYDDGHAAERVVDRIEEVIGK